MAYTQAQLTTMFTNAQTGVAPNAAQSLTLQAIATQNATGQLTDAQALAQTTNLAANSTTDVSVGAYEFFLGFAPSVAGLTSLNTAYTGTGAQAGLNGENRFIAESVALATLNTTAKAAFTASYGTLSVAAATAAAYNIIIGNPAAVAAGVDVAAAVAFLSSTASVTYYTNFIKANTSLTTAADIDLAVKAAIIGEIMFIADGYNNGAGLGAYATATNALVADLADDGKLTADNAAGIDLFTAYPSSAPGVTTILTVNPDVVVGSAGNDTFTATIGGGTTDTITAADTINGGAGRDALNITVTAGTAVLGGADVKNVEVLNVRNVGGGAATVAADGFSEVWNDRGTGTLAVTNAASGTVVGIRGNGSVTVGATTAGYAATATAASLAVADGVTAGAFTVTGAGLTSATITSTGAANSLAAIAFAGGTVKTATIDAQSDLTTGNLTGFAAATTVNVKGAGKASIGTLEAATVTTLDASANTGGVTAVLNAVTTLKVTGGSGNDKFTTGSVLTTGSVAAGAGTDRLVVATAADVATTALWAKYTGFEQVQTAGQNLDLALLGAAGVTSVFASGTLTLDNATTQAITITGASTPTINVTGAATVGQLDTLNLTISDEASTTSTIVLTAPVIAGVETINFNAVDNLTVSALTGVGAFTAIGVTGAGAVNIATGALALNPNSKIDASAATGAVTLDASAGTVNGIELIGTTSSKVNTLTGSAQADKITGGAGADVLVGGGGADVINAGAGNDSITGGLGADVMSGGAGTNTFVFTAAGADFTAATAAALITAADTITDWSAGTTNKIDFGATTLSSSIHAAAAISGTANVTATGLATFNTADNTLALKLAAVVAAVGTDAIGTSVIFADGADSYLFVVGDATAGVQAGDALIKLTGVAASTGLTFTAGDITTLS
ncbi:MAG: hypothetical protein JWP92_1127 [Caulobacter sp.]|nr:hypothetical protein [Caulobacter sp.]